MSPISSSICINSRLKKWCQSVLYCTHQPKNYLFWNRNLLFWWGNLTVSSGLARTPHDLWRPLLWEYLCCLLYDPVVYTSGEQLNILSRMFPPMVLGIIPKEKWENTSPRLPSHWLKLWKTREGAHAAVVIQHLSRSSFDHCVTATNGKEFQHRNTCLANPWNFQRLIFL